MGLLQKLKSVLGIDGRRGQPSPSDPDVTVEREPSAESERAVKQGESAGASASGTADDTPRAPRSANNVGSERATDASATEEGGTKETATEETTTEGTATEETGDVTDDATGDAADDATAGAASDDTEASEPSRASGVSETPSATVDEINGIGPTYADRLTAAGIETVADLADADTQTVADAAETSPARAEDWLEQARDF